MGLDLQRARGLHPRPVTLSHLLGQTQVHCQPAPHPSPAGRRGASSHERSVPLSHAGTLSSSLADPSFHLPGIPVDPRTQWSPHRPGKRGQMSQIILERGWQGHLGRQEHRRLQMLPLRDCGCPESSREAPPSCFPDTLLQPLPDPRQTGWAVVGIALTYPHAAWCPGSSKSCSVSF